MDHVEILKALGDENRLKIMCILSEGTQCVCHLETALTISQSSTSKHLQRLKVVGLIEATKKGQWVHYHIPSEVYQKYPFIKELLNQLLKDPSYVRLVKECHCK